jgi:hypothetical protein
VEELGLPAVAVACTGFPFMVRTIAKKSGFPDLRIAEYPAPIALDDPATLQKNVEETLVPRILSALTEPVKSTVKAKKRGPQDGDIVFEGNLEEVQSFFHEKHWTDGLPIVPPTLERVEAFLKYTDRSPDEVLGVLEPAMGVCSVWKVAVNGVMSGCRPEYMPILLAIAEIMSDSSFSIKDSGATPGWEAIIMLNGPIRDQLGFNYKVGHQRPGTQPNISIGRFYRMLVRNIAGSLVGSTDMSTHGQMFRAVAPENDQVCAEIGWKTLGEEQGFPPGENVVTITSGRVTSDPFQSTGDQAEQHLDYLTDWVQRMIEPYEAMRRYQETHVLFLSPVVAKLLSSQGYAKEDVNRYIQEHAKVTARYFEKNSSRFNNCKPYSLKDAVEKEELPQKWYESDDPERMAPLLSPEARVVVFVTGDPTRNRSLFFRQNYSQGRLTSRVIKLPDHWERLLKAGV